MFQRIAAVTRGMPVGEHAPRKIIRDRCLELTLISEGLHSTSFGLVHIRRDQRGLQRHAAPGWRVALMYLAKGTVTGRVRRLERG